MFKKIPILMYHSIEPQRSKRIVRAERFYNVTPGDFTAHMVYLKAHGHTAISLADLLLNDRNNQLPERPVLLTFDDGYISHYDTVLPMLKKAGLKAAFFIAGNDVGNANRMGWEHIRELVRAGMDIGSQGMSHEGLNGASYMELIAELKSSKLMLEDELGIEVTAFSVPHGLYSQRISDVARGMGYKLVFTAFAGNASIYSDQYCIRRLTMRKGYFMKDFKAIMQNDALFMLRRQVEKTAKDGLKAAVGVDRYNKIKESMLSWAYKA